MKAEEGQREKLKTEMERLHTYITQLSQTFYDPDKEKVMVNYPNNSEGRQLEQVYHEVFKHLLTVKKELDYYSLPIIDTGILKMGRRNDLSLNLFGKTCLFQQEWI